MTTVDRRPSQGQFSEILDRLPPANLDAEKGFLGSILLSHEILDSVADLVRPSDFYAAAHETLYQTMLDLDASGRHTDTTTLTNELRRAGKLEAVGGMAYLAEVIHSVAVAAHAGQYAEIVAEKARLRRIIHASVEAIRDCYNDSDAPEAIADRLGCEIGTIADDARGSNLVTAADAARQACERFDELRARTGRASVLTGLWEIDNTIGGLFPGEMTILAARPMLGKTSLAFQIARHCGSRNRLTYFGTMEMGAAELACRTLIGMAGVTSQKARTGDLTDVEMTRIVDASNEFAKATILIDERPSLGTQEIRRACRKLMKQGLSLACVDYLGLLRPDDRKAPREQQVAQQARDLKQLARELKVPVLVLCQLNRQADPEEEPELRHLRESGAIEQHADNVWFLWQHSPTVDEPWNAEFGVAKQRNGETGTFHLQWIGQETRFESPMPDDFDEWCSAR